MKHATPPSATLSGASHTFAIFLAAALAFVGLGYVLAALGPANPVIVGRGVDPILLPNTVGVYPEPLDRFLLISLVLSVPFLVGAAIGLSKRLGEPLADPRPVFFSLVGFMLWICIIRGATPELARFVDGLQWTATGLCVVGACLLLALPQHLHGKANRISLLTAIAVSALMIASQRIWTLDSAVHYNGPFSSHYEAVTSALVRIAGGGTCLVEVIPQYGCLGEYFSPFLQLLGSRIVVITSIFTVLSIVALSAAMVFAWWLIERPLMLIGCLLGLIVAVALNLIYDNPDQILQYFPVRFLFPSLSLLLAVWYRQSPGLGRTLAAGAFSGVALTWNLESGIAVTGALGLFAGLKPFITPVEGASSPFAVAAGRVAAFAVAVILVLALFIAYLFIKSGSTPDFPKYILFQTVFFVTGFGMIPILPFPDYWTMHVAVLFCTLILATVWVSSGTRLADPKLEMAAYAAVLGIGLLLYYTGRSHILVLRLVAWPSILLFFFLLDRTAARVTNRTGRVAVGAVAVISCALPAAFLLNTAPAVAHLAATVRAAPPDQNALVREDIAFIQAHAAPAERIAIVGINQGVLYGESGMRPDLEGPGVAEMIRRVDRDDQVDMLVKRGPDKVFLGTDLSAAAERGLLGTNIDIDLGELRKAYALEALGPGGRLILLRRKPFAGKDLFDAYPGE
ncbi:hypothetical protein [Microvirga antarctica]|uniref:hypothetical protein n=1 Tax=Microvirga antarctica TaxID=2819233 RepID=UPI001B3031FD|nr:hypothetical protein [Microvirga antarctica]